MKSRMMFSCRKLLSSSKLLQTIVTMLLIERVIAVSEVTLAKEDITPTETERDTILQSHRFNPELPSGRSKNYNDGLADHSDVSNENKQQPLHDSSAEPEHLSNYLARNTISHHEFPSGRSKNTALNPTSQSGLISKVKDISAEISNSLPESVSQNSKNSITKLKLHSEFPFGRTKNIAPWPGFPSRRTKNSAPAFEFPSGRTKNSAPAFEFPSGRTKNSAPSFEFPSGRTKNSALAFEFPAGRTKNSAPGGPDFPSGRTKNSAPKPEFPSGRTKNSDSNTNSNDSSICFPYFILQDIESLLAQASRMMDKAQDDRQKGWIQLFVRKLEALSQQLRSLPVKHRNMCFQSRKEILSKSGLSEDIFEFLPEEMQLHYAKKLFDVQPEPLTLKTAPKQSASEGVLDQNVLGQEKHQSNKRLFLSSYPVKRFHTRQHNSGANESKDGKNGEQQKNYLIAPVMDRDHLMLTTPQDQSEFTENKNKTKVTSPVRHIKDFLPLAYWYSQGMTAENMPFLPRSTRKEIPRPILQKLAYHSDNSKSNLNLRKEDISETTISSKVTPTKTVSQNYENVGPRTGSAKSATETNLNTEQSGLRPTTESSDVLSTTESNSNKKEDARQPRESFDENSVNDNRNNEGLYGHSFDGSDVLSRQLHVAKESKYQKPDDMRSILSEEDVAYEPIAMPSIQSRNKNQAFNVVRLESSIPLGDRNINSIVEPGEIPQVNNNNPENVMDFDYEEQGAAAGELYTEDENNPPKNIAIPSSPNNIVVSPHPEKTSTYVEDEAFRQLQELKTSSGTDANCNCTSNQESSVKPGHVHVFKSEGKM